MAVIDACMHARDLVIKLQSYWYYSVETAKKLFGAEFNWD